MLFFQQIRVLSSRWLTDRARRSRRTTTRTSPARISRISRASSGRARERAGAVLLKNRRAAGGAQLAGLGVGRLILGRDAGVAQKAARRPVGGDGSFVTFLWSAPLRSPIRLLMLAAFNRSWRLASRD